MNADLRWVPFDRIERFMRQGFEAIGVPAADAAICAEVLIAADKLGIDSHGVGRFKTIYYDRIVRDRIQQPVTQFEVVRDDRATAVVDGHHGMGMVISRRCMEMAIEKARQHGLGMVVARNSTHYGIAGYYARQACAVGMIGLTGTNARPSIAPTFGVEPLLGTNPLVFGIPTDEDFNFTNDYATSITQRGKIELYARLGRAMPAGWVIDRQGRARTDAEGVLKDLVSEQAALAPLGGIGEELGGYKGYGYATVVEILSSALQQGAFLKRLNGIEDGRKVPYRLGHFFMAIDISAFCDLAAFKRATGDLLRELRASHLAPGAERIYTSGEKEYLAWLDRKDKGVPLPPATLKELLTVCADLGMKPQEYGLM
ncbi:MAG: Ldh family oxidoreductase [Kiritimatiellae bacterium]|nr:Ldh family oxidoreductase [Kiritimatiellia bacterium]